MIFKDDQNCHAFVKHLNSILEQTETSCFAWYLMPSHFHLLLRIGAVPIATVMRRLATGHAIRYNRRHRRHGYLFMNRYKSIPCREDRTLLELLCYIHLNPLRAKLVADLDELDRYPFSGHGVVIGTHEKPSQNIEEVLEQFGSRIESARRSYGESVAGGIPGGRREDLTGRGLIRNSGGMGSGQGVEKVRHSPEK